MENASSGYTYDGKFTKNILVVGRTGSGKTTFIQHLGKNELFRTEITDVFWVSKIILSSNRENAIRKSFNNQDVHFNYPSDLDEFNYLLGNFAQEKSDYVDEDGEKIGENLVVSRLIIMNYVSGLADKSEDFSNFLTVSRKYGFSCLYFFHTIYPGRQSWEMIMSQTHIFFPGSIHSSRILKTLSLFASRQKNSYLPNQQVWLNKLYFQISNSKEKKCLTIDTREVNDLGPGKFRTSASNSEVQTCYFNRNKSDTYFNSFQSKRILPKEPVRFSIVKSNFNCFELFNKSLDIELKNSLSNLNETKQQTAKTDSKKDFNNGRSEQVCFSTRRTEPTNLHQRGGGHKRREQTREKSRKKTKFISAS